MIEYSKSWFGLGLLTTFRGSAFPRALPFALLATACSALVSQFESSWLPHLWRHPFAYSIFSSIVGFMLIFRCEALLHDC
jgi:predicted membrane chloride channel (bestrophin family)